MGYTHYWRQKRAFTEGEWQIIVAESKRICAKATRALYCGPEDFASATSCEHDDNGFRVGFKEEGAWRTFAHPEIATPMQGQGIKLAGPSGEGSPAFDADSIALNGAVPNEDYESFVLERAPIAEGWQSKDPATKRDGIFNFCKTEYRPYDAVVVSILHVARTVAPDAITVTSDGGPEAIKLVF